MVDAACHWAGFKPENWSWYNIELRNISLLQTHIFITMFVTTSIYSSQLVRTWICRGYISFIAGEAYVERYTCLIISLLLSIYSIWWKNVLCCNKKVYVFIKILTLLPNFGFMYTNIFIHRSWTWGWSGQMMCTLDGVWSLEASSSTPPSWGTQYMLT